MSDSERAAHIRGRYALAGVMVTAAVGLVVAWLSPAVVIPWLQDQPQDQTRETGTDVVTDHERGADVAGDTALSATATVDRPAPGAEPDAQSVIETGTVDFRDQAARAVCGTGVQISARPVRDLSSRAYSSVRVTVAGGDVFDMPPLAEVALSTTCRIVGAEPQEFASGRWGRGLPSKRR